MKLLVFLAVWLVAISADEIILNNSGYYWRDWNVKEPIPVDAVPGSVGFIGHKTFIARTVFAKTGAIVPGKASPTAQKMWFESGNLEYESTKDISILCTLNRNRFRWVSTKMNDLVSNVEKDQLVLVVGGTEKTRPVAIGRKIILNMVEIGKVVVNDVTKQFFDLRVTENGKGYGISDSYEVLVYDKTPNSCNNVVVELP